MLIHMTLAATLMHVHSSRARELCARHGIPTSGRVLLTNYAATGARNHDGRPYGGNRVSSDWKLFPPGTKMILGTGRRHEMCDTSDTGGAVHGLHIDAPCRYFTSLTGIPTHGGRTGSCYVSYRVVSFGESLGQKVRKAAAKRRAARLKAKALKRQRTALKRERLLDRLSRRRGLDGSRLHWKGRRQLEDL